MLSIRNLFRWLTAISLLSCAVVFVAHSQAQQDDSLEDNFKSGPSLGQRAFASTCAGCHGLDGRGSEKAPNIAGNTRVQHLTDAQISSIISNGVAGTGMPAFHSFTSAQVRVLVGYLHVLQGQNASRALPGDAASGKKIFFAKADCSSCHAVTGEGGFLGPDLSTYGSSMSADAILKAILDPVRIAPLGFKPAVVTTRDGTRKEGVIRNEDNFSVQLQTVDGTFHFLDKSEIKTLEYSSHSAMPSDYSDRLSRGELNDLVSYLMSIGSSSSSSKTSAKEHSAP